MRIIFKVSQQAILSLQLESGQAEFSKVTILNRSLVAACYPAILDGNHQVGALVELLKLYTGLSGNLSIYDLATTFEYCIPYVELQPNLMIEFQDN